MKRRNPVMWHVWRACEHTAHGVAMIFFYPLILFGSIGNWCNTRAWMARSRYAAKYPDRNKVHDPNFVRAEVVE